MEQLRRQLEDAMKEMVLLKKEMEDMTDVNKKQLQAVKNAVKRKVYFCLCNDPTNPNQAVWRAYDPRTQQELNHSRLEAQQQKLSSGDAKRAAPSDSSRPQVGQVVHAVKVFAKKEDHQQLEQLQEQYLSHIIDKKQLEQNIRAVVGDSALRQAIASLFPRGGGPGQAAKDNSTEGRPSYPKSVRMKLDNGQYYRIYTDEHGEMKQKNERLNTDRDVIALNHAQFSDLPDSWSRGDCDHDLVGHCLIPLNKTEEEYKQTVRKFVDGGMEARKVTEISRVQNPIMWTEHMLKQQKMSRGGKVIIKFGFHGCERGSVDGIVRGGLDPQYCGKNGTSFGQGTYAAVKSSYSDHNRYTRVGPDGEKSMFVVRILTQDLVRGEPDMRTAPDDVGGHHVAVDNVDNPSMYVSFVLNQMYPLYLIKYV